MSRPPLALSDRFRAVLVADADLDVGAPLLVAVSGGLDSVVLLHLLRFHVPERSVVAAHFDHGMRPSSRDDALWVTGLCRAWGVPLMRGQASAVPSSEDGARQARYAFLERVRRESGASRVLTAHHADDQAETVLFRILRGTGLAGLGGIPAKREPSLARPLLGFWRAELEAYATGVRLQWREDPSNLDLRYARNVLRHRVLPDVERLVAPGARRALVRLADRAGDEEAAWASVLSPLLLGLDVRVEAPGLSLDRQAVVDLHPAVRARVLRRLSSDLGFRLDEAATLRAVEFSASGGSGRSIELGGGAKLARALGRLVLSRGGATPRDRPLAIPDAGPGRGEALLGGRRVSVEWGHHRGAPGGGIQHSFDLEHLRFPLCVRGREAGDRIRLPGGTKKVKALLLEERIPHTRRASLVLVVDAAGDVLWIPEVGRAEAGAGASDRAPESVCWIGIR